MHLDPIGIDPQSLSGQRRYVAGIIRGIVPRILSVFETEAIGALKRQLEQLVEVSKRGPDDPGFKSWRMMTAEVLKHYTPNTPYRLKFINLAFTVARMYHPVDPHEVFEKACQDAKAILETAIQHIERLGLSDVGNKPGPAASSGGLHFHGPVTIGNQAIASGNAVQNVSQTANIQINALSEIKTLLKQSEELKGKEVRESKEGIDNLTVELAKPECARNWKEIATWTSLVLATADKATDVYNKIAPHLPHIVQLLDHAKRFLG
jgi:hypothetical protein